jgi:hypothetical protein
MIEILDILAKYLQDKFAEKMAMSVGKKIDPPIPHIILPVELLIECERIAKMLVKAYSEICEFALSDLEIC